MTDGDYGGSGQVVSRAAISKLWVLFMSQQEVGCYIFDCTYINRSSERLLVVCAVRQPNQFANKPRSTL